MILKGKLILCNSLTIKYQLFLGFNAIKIALQWEQQKNLLSFDYIMVTFLLFGREKKIEIMLDLKQLKYWADNSMNSPKAGFKGTSSTNNWGLITAWNGGWIKCRQPRAVGPLAAWSQSVPEQCCLATPAQCESAKALGEKALIWSLLPLVVPLRTNQPLCPKGTHVLSIVPYYLWTGLFLRLSMSRGKWKLYDGKHDTI